MGPRRGPVLGSALFTKGRQLDNSQPLGVQPTPTTVGAFRNSDKERARLAGDCYFETPEILEVLPPNRHEPLDV